MNDFGPNCSIILPGPCNAKCAFCFWKHSPVADNYLKRLDDMLSSLPARFMQCSITGGEPTLSPFLAPVLERVRQRFTKLVLTTNGAELAINVDTLECVDALNISRHHWNDDENAIAFGAKAISAGELFGGIHLMELRGVPVTLSCVLPVDADSEWCCRYVSFARQAGASQVFFRKQHGDLSPHPAELGFSGWKMRESSCPVCVSRSFTLGGMPVTFKRGTLEPSKDLGDIYEVIFHPSGKLTSDWEGKHGLLVPPSQKPRPKRNLPSFSSGCGEPVYQGCGSYSRSSGCGGGSSWGCL